jgi:hypothetical protein
MEHSLHIAAKHFVEAVSPSSPISIRKKVKAALAKARDNGELGLNEFNEAVASINPGDQGDSDSDSDDEDGNGDKDDDYSDFKPGDSLGKALALVKQVRYPLCVMIPTNPVFRFGCLHRQECFSNRHAVRLGSNLLSFSFGFVPVGHHYTNFLIDC